MSIPEPGGRRRVTMEDVAREVGVHRSTVSLALRNHPSVPEGTRARVRAVVERLEYRPNPQLVSLMEAVRRGRGPGSGAVLALLHAQPTTAVEPPFVVSGEMYAGVAARARELGFGLVAHRIRAGDGSGEALGRVLRARAVAGVIVGPMLRPRERFEFPWHHFACAAIGFSLGEPVLHRAVAHQAHVMRTALEALLERGYRRVGVVEHLEQDERVDRSYTGALFAWQWRRPVEDRVSPLLEREVSLERFREWLGRERPDAVVTETVPVMEWLAAAGLAVPGDIGIAVLNTVIHDASVAGVDQRYRTVGATAVDLVAAQVYRNETGVPAEARVLMTESVWRDGATVRARVR